MKGRGSKKSKNCPRGFEQVVLDQPLILTTFLLGIEV